MDTSGDCSERLTPISLHQMSSHTSTTSFTPSTSNLDYTQNMWNDQTMNTERRAVLVSEPQLQMDTDISFIDGNFGDTFFEQFDENGMLRAKGDAGPLAGRTGLTPGSSDSFVGGTGFTPGPTGDVLGMSDAEWKQMLDNGLPEMGWAAGVPRTGAHEVQR